jgi:hypothetical protein
MDRRLADRNLRSGLFAAAIAVGMFGAAFVFAIYYLG